MEREKRKTTSLEHDESRGMQRLQGSVILVVYGKSLRLTKLLFTAEILGSCCPLMLAK